MVGMAVAFGNGMGPLVGRALTQAIGWQCAFWFVCPLCVITIVYLLLVWPISRSISTGTRTRDKLKLADWAGAFASPCSVALLLEGNQCQSDGLITLNYDLHSEFAMRPHHFLGLPSGCKYAYCWCNTLWCLFGDRVAVGEATSVTGSTVLL